MRKKTMLLRLVLIAGIVCFSSIQLYAQSVVLTETDVKEDNSAVKIVYSTNRSIAVECYDLSVPPQIIVDFMGDVYSKEPEVKIINKGVVKQMRVIKGTKTSPELDSSYYSVDFIIIDLKEAVRYDFDQGLTTSVLVISKPGKPLQEAKAAKEEAARAASKVPALEFVKKETPPAKIPVSMAEKEQEQTVAVPAPKQVEASKKGITEAPKTSAKKKKTLRKKISRGLKSFFSFGRSKEKTPEQMKAELKKETKRQEKIEKAKKRKVTAAKKRELRRKKKSAKAPVVKKTKPKKIVRKKAMLDPSKQVVAAKRKVIELEAEILKPKEQLKAADEQVKLAEKDQSTIAQRIEFSKAKVELAKNAYDTSMQHMKLAQSAANSVWMEYSNAKAKLSSSLDNGVEEKIIDDAQKTYDGKKSELENVIKAAEEAKKETDAKLDEFNKAEKESEDISSESQNLVKKVTRTKEEYAAKENSLKEKQNALETAKQELEDANVALKRYELEKADEEYKKSLALIDSQMMKQKEEEQRKADQAKMQKMEKQRLQKLESEKEAKEQILLDEIKAKKAKEDAQLAALAAIEEDRKMKKEAARKRPVSKRVDSRKKSRKVNMPGKKVSKTGNGLRGEVLESALDLRNAGLEMQRKGDFDSAVKYYQQALMQDPKYATVHNDLGILYEQKGLENKAKMEYLTTLKIDPQYIKAHSNLALLYEKLGDYKKAYYHWKQRVHLGRENDPWTLKAKKRMQMLENRK